MDDFLVRYLKSGKAWVLVGSGLSNAMGYPSWKELAVRAREVTHAEARGSDLRLLDKALAAGDFPAVFQYAENLLGRPRLRQCLQDVLKPTDDDGVYDLVARWPVPIYLTTNYDDEISTKLARLGEAYIPCSNSADNFCQLIPGASGLIIKLHGDLRSDEGLILTRRDYKEISESDKWAFWRTRLTSIFQMNPVVIIGHSLTDPHIRHILQAAKEGAGVYMPICWIAPNVASNVAKDFLELYRIRVISYHDKDGQHRNLARLVETISNFLPLRTAVHIKSEIDDVSKSALGENAAAPGFYVFNTLARHADFDKKRVDIVAAAVQAVLPKLGKSEAFDFREALSVAGWPDNLPIEAQFEEAILRQLLDEGALKTADRKFKADPEAAARSRELRNTFETMRKRFITSVKLRIRRKHPEVSEESAAHVASDIEAALTGFFREGGLSLATTLYAAKPGTYRRTIPISLLKFFSEASAKYDDLLRRQAFITGAVDAFVEGEEAERQYLGRVAQGFFSFHALGVFGEAAQERLELAAQTVWLIDSEAQIPALALGAPTSYAFSSCFQKLKSSGIRLFTTEKLFWETRDHVWFANHVVGQYGTDSPMIIAAATGQAPYYKSNQFLEGFIKWQEAGNPRDWGAYMQSIFGHRSWRTEHIRERLTELGIEVIDFENWPGFEQTDYHEVDLYTEQILKLRENLSNLETADIEELRKKAKPEGEAFALAKNEQIGKCYMLKRGKSSAWFVSHTSILNLLEPPLKVTWLPEAFLAFVSTLSAGPLDKMADVSFETLLWGLAQSGMTLLDEATVEKVFGGIIDQATIDIAGQRETYRDTLQEKYVEPITSVMKKVEPMYRPLAVVQLASEMAQVAESKRLKAEQRADEAEKQAKLLESKLKAVERFQKKMEAKLGRKTGTSKKVKSKKVKSKKKH